MWLFDPSQSLGPHWQDWANIMAALPLLATGGESKGAASRLLFNGSALSTAALTSGQRTRPDIRISEANAQEPASRAPRLASSPRERACTELLLSGHVEAFTALFVLTTSTTDTHHGEKLVVLQKHLVRAEDADRLNDTTGAYQAYKHLATYFEQIGNLETALQFRNRCNALVEAAGGNNTRKIEACYLTGVSMEKAGHLEDAITAFTAMHAMTVGRSASDPMLSSLGYTESCTCLARVLAAKGQQVAKQGDTADAIDLYERTLAVASEGAVGELEATATYHLGLLLEQVHEPRLALQVGSTRCG